MSGRKEWEDLRLRTAERFGEESVFGEGPLDAGLAIVGEAPGREEVEKGRPFVGSAGRLLDRLLEDAGIDRREVYVTNIVKVRPTEKSGGRTRNRPPRAAEIREGLEVLREELGIVKPDVLALLGATPARALIKKSLTLGSDRGTIFHSTLGPPALATYHPAYLLRIKGTGEDYDRLWREVVEDLALARRRVGGRS